MKRITALARPLPPGHKPSFDSRWQGGIYFSDQDMERLYGKNSWLSCSCIENCIALLVKKFPPPEGLSAAFLPARLFTIANDRDLLSRGTKNLRYGHADMWLLPVCINSHWVLCVIYPEINVIHLLNSFGNADEAICDDVLPVSG